MTGVRSKKCSSFVVARSIQGRCWENKWKFDVPAFCAPIPAGMSEVSEGGRVVEQCHKDVKDCGGKQMKVRWGDGAMRPLTKECWLLRIMILCGVPPGPITRPRSLWDTETKHIEPRWCKPFSFVPPDTKPTAIHQQNAHPTACDKHGSARCHLPTQQEFGQAKRWQVSKKGKSAQIK